MGGDFLQSGLCKYQEFRPRKRLITWGRQGRVTDLKPAME